MLDGGLGVEQQVCAVGSVSYGGSACGVRDSPGIGVDRAHYAWRERCPRWALLRSRKSPISLCLPLSAFIFFVSSIAETARSPFDLLEAESEIVAGFHTEYSGMKFALFFIAEYGNMFAVSMLTTVVFLGGYRFFGLEEALPFLAPVIIILKALVIVFIFLWMRGTLPRLRIDQLLAFNWKFMVPLSLAEYLGGGDCCQAVAGGGC